MTSQNSDIRSVIRQADDAFEQNFAGGDAAGLANLYTDDAMLLPTGSDYVKGKSAVQAFWQGAIDMGIDEAKLHIDEVELHGDRVIDVGRYTLKAADGTVLDHGKYLVIWKQEGGQWKLHRDIWNTSQAAE